MSRRREKKCGPMTPTMYRLMVAYHEAGHAAMGWYLGEEISRVTVEPEGDFLGQTFFRGEDESEVLKTKPPNAYTKMEGEKQILQLLGGPVAEHLFCGKDPCKPIRFRDGFWSPRLDGPRVRRLVRVLKGRNDKEYQFRLQEQCREILREKKMWDAIRRVAWLLSLLGNMEGDAVVAIFKRVRAPQCEDVRRERRREMARRRRASLRDDFTEDDFKEVLRYRICGDEDDGVPSGDAGRRPHRRAGMPIPRRSLWVVNLKCGHNHLRTREMLTPSNTDLTIGGAA